MSIKLASESHPLERGKGGLQYFGWRVWVDEPPERLNEIEEVEYLLHPTFPEPLQTRTDPATNFELRSSGWGEFTIGVRVTFKDGTIEDQTFYLELGEMAKEKEQYYVVQPGDTMLAIADKFKVSMNSLVEANDVQNANLIGVGQLLKIPPEA